MQSSSIKLPETNVAKSSSESDSDWLSCGGHGGAGSGVSVAVVAVVFVGRVDGVVDDFLYGFTVMGRAADATGGRFSCCCWSRCCSSSLALSTASRCSCVIP